MVFDPHPILESCGILVSFFLDHTGTTGVFLVTEKTVRPAVSPSVNRRDLPLGGCVSAVVWISQYLHGSLHCCLYCCLESRRSGERSKLVECFINGGSEGGWSGSDGWFFQEDAELRDGILKEGFVGIVVSAIGAGGSLAVILFLSKAEVGLEVVVCPVGRKFYTPLSAGCGEEGVGFNDLYPVQIF